MNSNGRRALIIKYFTIVGMIVLSFLLIGGTAVFVYSAMQSSGEPAQTPAPLTPSGTPSPLEDDGGQAGQQSEINKMFMPPDRTNVLVLGIHALGGISDAILLVTFDAVNNKIDVVSLQRDTLVNLPQEDVSALRALGRVMTPSNGIMKLGELHSYAGNEYGPAYVKDYVQNMLGISIDYTVVMQLSAFRYIVDAVGGIYMDIPAGGLKYSDPEQNLYINVPGGRQLLNGNLAEGVVRFRDTYANGDLGRIEVQHQFMKNFFEQTLSKETIKDNLLTFISTVISYVKTDFGIDDIPKYLSAIGQLKPESIEFHSLPGTTEWINNGSYYIYSEREGKEFIDKIFSAPKEAGAGETQYIIDKTLDIQVLNGTLVNRLASKMSETLTAAGYTVKNTGTYQGVRREPTRIMVRDKALGEQFKQYFVYAVVEEDAGISQDYDVVIIVGTTEEPNR